MKAMKKKYIFLAAMGFVVLPMVAQETYQDTKLIGNDLNGTARYVGMGGAMEALGADISTMQSNPAGIGLFRRSQASLSGGLVMQADADTHQYGISIKGEGTNASFDQIGFVWTRQTGQNSFLNVGFNYHKSRNFDQIMMAAGKLDNASLGKLTSMKYNTPGISADAWSGVDATYKDMLETVDENGNKVLPFYNGSQYMFGQYQKGYIGEYDFNVSGNIHDRVYLGLTFGLHDVNYRSNKYYTEDLDNGIVSENWEQLKIDGTGFDVKAGVIFRPVETSPFRIGLYVNTPVFYELTQRNAFDASISDNGVSDAGNYADYDFKVYTPWKFGVSIGHTINNVAALGVTYEYSKYSAIDNRINDGGYYDGWTGSYYEESSSDENMNYDTELNLNGVHTLKLGAEIKPIPEFAVRIGYNYVSPVFKDNAYRDVSLASPGVGYATSADYTNWKATNRFTLGIGYSYKNFFADVAYQYCQTNGVFHPFMDYYQNEDFSPSEYDNIAEGTKVSFKRNQLLFTLGYRF